MRKRILLAKNALLAAGDLLLAAAAPFAARFAIAGDALSYAAVLQTGPSALAAAAGAGLLFYLAGLFSLERMSRQRYPTHLLRLITAMSALSCLALTTRFLTGGLSGASAGRSLALALALQFFAAALWHFVFWHAARAQRQLGKILLRRYRC